jgi:hypothetical protein
MSLHIDRFVDLVRSHDARGRKEIIMPIRDARDLMADITKLLNQLQNTNTNNTSSTTQTVEITGGNF